MADQKPATDHAARVRPVAPKQECFIVMPITDPEGYEAGHFGRVYEDIFCPACELAGYAPIRADQVRETNMIHLDVLQRLLDSPMVLCDLSSHNPNVLFELGLRQAFDKPVVLVQEVGTPRIFDIAPLRYAEYRRARIYNQVLEDQKSIAETLKATRDSYGKGAGINSIVRILALTRPAALSEVQEAANDPALQIIRAELSELRSEIRRSLAQGTSSEKIPIDWETMSTILSAFESRVIEMQVTGEVDRALSKNIAAYYNLLASFKQQLVSMEARSRADQLAVRLAELERVYNLLVDESRGR